MAKAYRILDDEEESNKPTEAQISEGRSTSTAYQPSTPPTTSNTHTGTPRRQQTTSTDVDQKAGDDEILVRSTSWRPSPRALSTDERAEAKEAYMMFDLEATGKLRLRPLKMAFRALGIKVPPHRLGRPRNPCCFGRSYPFNYCDPSQRESIFVIGQSTHNR